ncbi:hypothetical protein [Jiella sp. M17.18]|uniref:hypothetical protein n=1 Tax=Jiella sp. M17.18 TaxID=3234247 RepID=UPI0034DE1155
MDEDGQYPMSASRPDAGRDITLSGADLLTIIDMLDRSLNHPDLPHDARERLRNVRRMIRHALDSDGSGAET